MDNIVKRVSEPYNHNSVQKQVGKEPERETILIVEDEYLLLKLLQEVFEGAGYNVIAVNTSVEALNIYRKRHSSITAVVADLGLPFVNGWELINMLRLEKNDLRAIVMTSFIEPCSRQEILRNRNISDVFIKPFNPFDLVERVKCLLAN